VSIAATNDRPIPDGARQTDFLVVGAGAAGCAAARALVDGTGVRVMLLESGGTNQRDDVRDPTRGRAVRFSDAGWRYLTVPQGGTNGRVHEWPMGRLVGGSTSLNGMIWTRGAQWDYDGWAAMGNPGWDAATVYDAFRALEDFEEGNPVDHGVGGPVKVTQIPPEHPLTAAFLQACDQRGYKPTKGFNGPEPEGYGAYAVNLADGRRQDAGHAFVTPIMSRPTFELITGATGAQLHLNDAADTVTGLSYVKDGRLHRIEVAEQVLVCAGAVASPQLLMLSGIGRPDDLRQLGVEVTVPLPAVGQNLHDHVAVTVGCEATKPFPRSRYQFAECGIYLRSDPSVQHYDLQMPMKQICESIPPGYLCDGPGFCFFGQVLTPESRGQLTLRSNDPLSQPLIDPAYLTEPADMDKLLSVMGAAREIASAPAFDEWRVREIAPGPARTEAGLRAYARAAAWTCYHPAGTCRMGPDPAEAVVDHELKVHGIENLRVADTSIMPRLNVGNTTAPAMMIGWRAAEFALAASGA
jgi:choline dehydrogenase